VQRFLLKQKDLPAAQRATLLKEVQDALAAGGAFCRWVVQISTSL
jgi:hypothetical protein